MTPKIRKIYSIALKDTEFRRQLVEADGDHLSGYHDEIEKHLITSMYYGWLVGNKGSKDWNDELEKEQ